MNESADESDLECFKRPVRGKQVGDIQTLKLTEDDLAAIQDTYYFISWGSIGLDFQKL